MHKKTFLYYGIALLLLLFANYSVNGQKKKKKIRVAGGMEVVFPDTVFVTHADTVLYLSKKEAEKIKVRKNQLGKSDEFYDSIATRISRQPVIGDIFEWIVTPRNGKQKQVNIMLRSERIFMPYEGYSIGKITFRRIDILEGSVVDTLRKASTKLGKLINRIHRDTRTRIIEDNLLFDTGDQFDPYQIADNERILRRFNSIRDARIYPHPRDGSEKIVDIEIVTQDVAPLGASGNFNSWQWFDASLYHVNLSGYAKELQVGYFRNTYRSPHNGFEATVYDPNLFGSFVRGQLQYANNYIHEKTLASFERDFFVPEIKYAGGVELYRTHENFYAEGYDTLETPYTENLMDVWLGRSFEFRKRSNFIISGRIQMNDFQDHPFVDADSNRFFQDRTLALASVALAKRNYLKATKIIGFGITEDVPIGYAITATMGKEWNAFSDRNYAGIRGTLARYSSRLGYFNVGAGFGGFLHSNYIEDGALNIESIYFSNLSRLRRSQVRQYVYGSYTRGINRQTDKSLFLSGKWEGSNNIIPIGTERLKVSFETVYFLPWYTYGFQFALYHNFEINLLNVEEKLFDPASLFPLVEVGLRTLNDNLVFPTLTVSLGYYIKNRDFDGAFQFKITTQLQKLFKSDQVFKPRTVAFE